MACGASIDDQLDLVTLWAEGSRALARVTHAWRAERGVELGHVQRATRPVLGVQLEPRLCHASEGRRQRGQQAFGRVPSRTSKARPMLGHDLLECRELSSLRATQVERHLSLAQRARVA